jgi:hypothetical protein
MTGQPLGKTARLFLIVSGSGFLVLAGGFLFILWKITR